MTATLSTIETPAEGPLAGTISISQAASRLGVSVDSIRRWTRSGDLPAWRLPSGVLRVRLDDVDALAVQVSVA